MKIGYFTVEGKDCFVEITAMLEREVSKSFKTEIIDGVIYFSEEFSVMTNSNQMAVIRVQKAKSSEHHCEIEIVSGGGRDTLSAITYGNEKRRLNKILDMVTDFCKYKKYKLSPLVVK